MLGAVALELMRCVSCKGKFSREICGNPPTCKVCRTWQRILNVLTSTQFPLRRESEALHILYTAIGQLDDLAAQEYQSRHTEGSAQARTERSQSEELEEEETEQIDSASESILRDRSPLPRRQIERKSKEAEADSRITGGATLRTGRGGEDRKKKGSKGKKKRERQALFKERRQEGKGKGRKGGKGAIKGKKDRRCLHDPKQKQKQKRGLADQLQ